MNKNAVSLGAMCAYEKITGRNAIHTLEIGEKISATDLVGMLYMVSYTKDPTTTMEKIEALEQDQITKLMAELTGTVVEQNVTTEPKSVR